MPYYDPYLAQQAGAAMGALQGQQAMMSYPALATQLVGSALKLRRQLGEDVWRRGFTERKFGEVKARQQRQEEWQKQMFAARQSQQAAQQALQQRRMGFQQQQWQQRLAQQQAEMQMGQAREERLAGYQQAQLGLAQQRFAQTTQLAETAAEEQQQRQQEVDEMILAYQQNPEMRGQIGMMLQARGLRPPTAAGRPPTEKALRGRFKAIREARETLRDRGASVDEIDEARSVLRMHGEPGALPESGRYDFEPDRPGGFWYRLKRGATSPGVPLGTASAFAYGGFPAVKRYLGGVFTLESPQEQRYDLQTEMRREQLEREQIAKLKARKR